MVSSTSRMIYGSSRRFKMTYTYASVSSSTGTSSCSSSCGTSSNGSIAPAATSVGDEEAKSFSSGLEAAVWGSRGLVLQQLLLLPAMLVRMIMSMRMRVGVSAVSRTAKHLLLLRR
jgi:hypothetical protein